MLLMSWAGEMADEANVANLNEEIKRSLQDMVREGVIHGDVRESNILWNVEQQRVMLIDFERSTPLSKVKNKVIEELSGRKRKRITGPHVSQKKRNLKGSIREC